MSWEATAYVKELRACPDSAPLSRGQKLLAFILADYHNTDNRRAWPSVPTLATESLTSLSQVKRDLAYLQQHFLIRKIHPEKMGRGWVCGYEFVELDAAKKGVHHHEPFLVAERGSKGVHFEQRNKEEQ